MGQSPDPSRPNKKLNQYNSYLRYSGLAILLFLVIGVFFSLLSMWLDPAKDMSEKLGGSAFLLLIVAFFLGLLSILDPRRHR